MPNITLNLHEINAVNEIKVNDNDKIIRASLRVSSKQYQLKQGCTVTLTVKKSGRDLKKPCSIEGSNIICNLGYFETGRYDCEFVITEDKHRLTTPRFIVDYKEE